jgi:hypothetical protein
VDDELCLYRPSRESRPKKSEYSSRDYNYLPLPIYTNSNAQAFWILYTWQFPRFFSAPGAARSREKWLFHFAFDFFQFKEFIVVIYNLYRCRPAAPWIINNQNLRQSWFGASNGNNFLLLSVCICRAIYIFYCCFLMQSKSVCRFLRPDRELSSIFTLWLWVLCWRTACTWNQSFSTHDWKCMLLLLLLPLKLLFVWVSYLKLLIKSANKASTGNKYSSYLLNFQFKLNF